MTLREISNPNLSVFYSDEIFAAKVTTNNFFSEHLIFEFTLVSLEVKP